MDRVKYLSIHHDMIIYIRSISFVVAELEIFVSLNARFSRPCLGTVSGSGGCGDSHIAW